MAGIVSSLPSEAVEWKRSYGRTSKSVFVEVEFQPFDVEELVKVEGLSRNTLKIGIYTLFSKSLN